MILFQPNRKTKSVHYKVSLQPNVSLSHKSQPKRNYSKSFLASHPDTVFLRQHPLNFHSSISHRFQTNKQSVRLMIQPTKIPEKRLFSTPHPLKDINKENESIFFPHSLAQYIRRFNPAFPLAHNQLKILHNPNTFYETVLSGIQKSKKKINLSCLYLGTEPQCLELMKCVQERCEALPDLKVHFQFDFLRATRKEKIDPTFSNSVDLIRKAQKQFPQQITCGLYKAPNTDGVLPSALPERVNEVMGVYHIKAFTFDDDVLISGANLNASYFTKRQDRYISIQSNPHLSGYIDRLLNMIYEFSWALDLDRVRPNFDPAFTGDRVAALILKKWKFFLATEDERHHNFLNDTSVDYETILTPTLQNGLADIRQDEETFSDLIHYTHGVPQSEIVISSPYFNLAPSVQQLLLNPEAAATTTKVLTASPKANGFYTAKDISRFIPKAYAALEKDFFEDIKRRQLQDHVQIYEYNRPEWTFHAKGLWATLEPGEFFTIFGSGNYGLRSQERDLELQFTLMTRNSELITAFQEEKTNLLSQSRGPIQRKDFDEADHRSNPLFQFFAKRFLSSFM